ncbi:hypothetical protein [Pantoea stewartii]|uniref:hypothetical protein n=1 Tax=Pantoea stewartii TaxID=66269 RepID=UPI000AB223C6|nr:hypothetical protein [Pantoea stewartii]
MMNKIFAVAALIAMCFLLSLFFPSGREESTAVACKAHVSYLWGKERLDLLISQSLHNGKGFLSVSGISYHSDNTKSYLDKSLSFSYHRNKDVYNFKSQMIMDSPQMTMSPSEEKRWFPEFFTNKGETLILKIRPYGKNAWLFYAGTTPLFVCERN